MRHRVLVVDDDQLVADTLRMVFLASGFESEACYSADEALKLARSFAPELMLCDIMMPGEDGLKLAAKVFHELPRCQLILLTAHLTNSARQELDVLRRKRPLTVLDKPCAPEVLLEEVSQLLGMRAPLHAAS